MKNKKFLRGSLKKELLILNIISFIIIGCGISYSISIAKNNDTVSLINRFNKAYVEIIKYVNRNDDNSKKYLIEASDLYNINSAIIDNEGNIYMKSKGVLEEKIDVNMIKNIFQNKYTDGNFYQQYDIRLDEQDYKLLIWRNQGSSAVIIKIFLSISVSFLLAILTIYLYTYKKVKYIGYLTKGINEFSSGNLEYRIIEKENNELGFLAKGMNLMANNLKNSIESERNQEKFKSELISNVSHDLRTPLTSIIGYLQLIDNEKTTEENKKKYVKNAIEKSYKLRDLIGDLFEYSKLQSNSVSLQMSNVNVIEIIEQSIGELYVEAMEKNIVFIKNYEYSNINLYIDSNKIGRVFQNILSNTVKYSVENSKVLIDINEDKNDVIISFENEIEQESLKDVDKIFNRFYRCNESRNSETPGSGLGLAIAKSIIDLHNGDIYAKCENNIFKIYVKLMK